MSQTYHLLRRGILHLAMVCCFTVPLGGTPEAQPVLTVRVGFYENSPKLFLDGKRQVSGFFPELLEEIARQENWRVIHVPGTWEQCLERLADGRIDIMPDVATTEARAARFLFGEEIVFNNWGVLYVGSGVRVEQLRDLGGKRVAVMQGSVHYSGPDGITNLLERFGIRDVRFIEVADYHEVFRLLAEGTADVGVVNRIFGNLHQARYKVSRTPIVFNPVPLKFAFPRQAVRSRMLAAAIDRHLRTMKSDAASAYFILLSKYFLENIFLDNREGDRQARFRALLTNEERAWIDAHPRIRVGIDPGFVPYEFRDEDGRAMGIALDYLDLINRRFGLNLELVDGLGWSETVRRAREGGIDVLPCIGITAERESFLSFTRPYLSFYRVIITRDDAPPIFGLTDLADRRIAVQEASSHHGYLKDNTAIMPQLFERFEDALEAVARGQADACVGNVTVASYWIKKTGLTHLRIAAPVSSTLHTLHFAVRKDWPVLVSILDKALSTVSYYEQETIRNRWIDVEVGPVRGWWRYVRFAAILLGALLLVVALVFAWNRKMAREIARRKASEVALRASEEEKSAVIVELERLNRLKNEYIGVMAHDLRNPICAIELMSSYLLDPANLPLADEPREFVTRIERLSRYMELLIEDILDYAKIEAGMIDLKKERVDYNGIVQDSVLVNAIIAGRKKISLESAPAADLPELECDRKKIEQVLHNLLSNAVKYSQPGSRVTIATRAVDGGIQTTVTDEGQGIPADELNRLFQPFQRTSVKATSGETSTGLGLAIVKRIVEAHGGTIGVESRVGEGSAFRFFLPGPGAADADPR